MGEVIEISEGNSPKMSLIAYEDAEIVFVSSVEQKISAELECASCKDVVRNAVRGNNCDHIFCESCLTVWKTKSATCPVCREPIKKIIACTTIRSIVAGMQVICQYCKDTLTYGAYEDHFKTKCLQVPCKCAMCEKIEPRETFVNHSSVCIYRREICPYPNCKRFICREEYEAHIQNCDCKVMTCFCEQEIMVADRKAHLRTCTFAQDRIIDRLLEYEDMNFNSLFRKKLKPEQEFVSVSKSKFSIEVNKHMASNVFIGTRGVYTFDDTFVFLTTNNSLILFPCMTVICQNVTVACQGPRQSVFFIQLQDNNYHLYVLHEKNLLKKTMFRSEVKRLFCAKNVLGILLTSGQLFYDDFRFKIGTQYYKKYFDIIGVGTEGDCSLRLYSPTHSYVLTPMKDRVAESNGVFVSTTYYRFGTTSTYQRILSEPGKKLQFKFQPSDKPSKCRGIYEDLTVDSRFLTWNVKKVTVNFFGYDPKKYTTKEFPEKIVAGCFVKNTAVFISKNGNLFTLEKSK